ncbi:unnamed protein product [Ambrosiozyma monospora]|uniref:Unnamed protein product n=1 Tax=Ambrosiozyma monospora TaxID=43982 RepID=A0ACB5TWM7_AMBMO|nr:unnamed protein product [Ambrosiozyma monospora]
MQPVYGTQLSLAHHLSNFCRICGGNGGLVNCRLCSMAAHLSCCQDSAGCFVGFEVDTNCKEKGHLVRLIDSGIVGKPKPVIICKRHTHESDFLKSMNLVSLRAKAKMFRGKEEMSLVRLYATEFKNCESPLSGGERLRHDYEALIDALKPYEVAFTKQPSNGSVTKSVKNTWSEKMSSSSTRHECVHCHNTRSLCWYDSPGSRRGEVCHQCFVRIKNNVTLIDTIPDLSRVNSVKLDGSKFGIYDFKPGFDNQRKPKQLPSVEIPAINSGQTVTDQSTRFPSASVTADSHKTS